MSDISLSTWIYGEPASSASRSSLRPGSPRWLCNRWGQAQFERITRLTASDRQPGESAWSAYLRHNGTEVAVIAGDPADIPSDGPLMLVANHPTGFPDGPAIGHLLGEVRRDFKALAARQLLDLPVAPDIIPIAVEGQLGAGGPGADPLNQRSFREAFRWLRTGGSLFVFPCGCGHGSKVRTGVLGRLIDAPWADNVMRLARRAKAAIVPVRIHNDPGLLRRLTHRIGREHYQLASKAEVLCVHNDVVRLSIFAPLLPDDYHDVSDTALAKHLRSLCTGTVS